MLYSSNASTTLWSCSKTWLTCDAEYSVILLQSRRNWNSQDIKFTIFYFFPLLDILFFHACECITKKVCCTIPYWNQSHYFRTDSLTRQKKKASWSGNILAANLGGKIQENNWIELNNVLKFAGINWLVLLLLGGSLTFVLLDCTLTSNMLQHWALRLLMVRQRKKNPSSLCGFIYIVYIIFCLSSLIHTINIFSSSNQDSFVESEYLTQ